MPNDVKDVFAMGLDEIWIGRGNVTEDIDDESAYDLAELDAFFRGRGISVPELFGGPEHALCFEEVNERFPVEIIGKGYCRYKVKQGGYYYVFWASRYRSTEKMKEVNEMVYFSAYIPSSRDVSMFESLEVGVSTAADVAAIDPSVQINVFLSHGIHTYSYLNKESLLEIEYEYIKTGNGLEDLVVKEIVVVPRDIKNAASVFCRLKNRDLPE